MPYLGIDIVFIRIMVKDFDAENLTFKYARAERVAYAPKKMPIWDALSIRERIGIRVCVYLMDWYTYEIMSPFACDRSLVSKSLDKMSISIPEFDM